MQHFLLEGPGGIPGLKLSTGSAIQSNSQWSFTNANGSAFSGPLTFLEPVVAISGSAATYAPTAAQSSTWFLLNPSAAQQINLPVPVVGVAYTFVVQTSATGTNTLKFLTDSSSTFMQGTDIISTVGGATTNFQANGSTHRSFNMNGTTTGGLVGTIINLTCLTATLWQVQAQNFGSGTLATSFGTS